MGTAEAGTGRARCLALGRCVRPPGCGTGSDGKGAMTRPRGHVRVPDSVPLGEAEGRVPVSAGKPT